MKLAKLRELFSYGIITDIRAVKDVLNGETGWRMEVTVNDDVETTMITALGGLKIYKTLEHLLNDVSRIKGYDNLDQESVIHVL